MVTSCYCCLLLLATGRCDGNIAEAFAIMSSGLREAKKERVSFLISMYRYEVGTMRMYKIYINLHEKGVRNREWTGDVI
jgi:hypothetical protein